MKKVLSRLFILTLGVTALSGCDFFASGEEVVKNRGDEVHEVKGLVLKDYSTSVFQGSNYLFDGKAYLDYVDSTIEDLDVTKECTFTTLDTSKTGTQEFKVSYEGSKYIYSKTTHINVIGLESIEVSNYNSEVKQNESYAFIGTVTATFSDNSTKDVTKDAKVDTSKIKTDVLGEYPLTVSYTAGVKTLTQTVQISVYGLDSIKVENYTSSVKKGTMYSFDGKVSALYTNQSVEVVTDRAEVNTSEVNIDQEGKYNVYVSFTDGGVTKTTSFEVSVYVDKPKLKNIVASDYTTTIEKGTAYTFDGVVTATYEDDTTEVVTNNCSFGSISTSTPGQKSLSISYTTNYSVNGKEYTNTKSTTASIFVNSTLVSISGDAIAIGVNRTKAISLTYNPSDATNKNVSYVSNDTSVATVDSTGKVTGKAVGNTTITVTSELSSSITAEIPVSVEAVVQDEWTILVYLCGADLESDSQQGGAATDDLTEIKTPTGQPDDVNVVIQAGGANSWKSTYSSVINKDKRNRFHLKNNAFVKDSQDSKVNMGLQSSFADFIVWGLTTYPADKVGLILWNHGGAMQGCCFDEQNSNNGLTPAEVAGAIKSARTTLGITNKFEFIGYDCCLMQVQDIAGLNSEYAKYQIASEESEWGYGWTYDEWIDDLFAKKSTENILKAIVDSFASETTAAYTQWQQIDPSYVNDQTLSYLDLSKWDAYETAWEDMASALSSVVNSSSKWNTLANVLKTCQRFGQTEDYYGNKIYPFDVFDVGSFCTKMKASSSYKSNSTLMSKIADVESAMSSLVKYEWHGSGSSGATGMTLFAPVSGYSSTSDYSTSSTPFTTWRNICTSYGSWN